VGSLLDRGDSGNEILARRQKSGYRPGPLHHLGGDGERRGRLFIDYLRNGRGTTAIGAYSPRARPSFRIAAPVTWKRVGVQLAVPTEYLLAHLFGIALAIADNLNDELSHGDNRVVGIDELEVG
jgi:hypothetical protein